MNQFWSFQNYDFFTYKIFNLIINFIKQSIIKSYEMLILPSKTIINQSTLWNLIQNGFGPGEVLYEIL